MRKLLFSLCCVLGIAAANGQTTTTISSGTTQVNTGVTYNIPFGFFVNNGVYIDTTSPGAMNVTGGVTFSGSGTTQEWNLNFLTSGTNDMSASGVQVFHTATLNSGVSLNAGAAKLNLRTDDFVAGAYRIASLVNNGLLTGTVNGLSIYLGGVDYRTATTSGACPFSPVLSLNISGTSMVYQWQNSSDNITFNSISGATNATYTPTVTAVGYYRCALSTSNTAYTQNTPSVQLTPTGLPSITITGGNVPLCTGSGYGVSGTGWPVVAGTSDTLVATSAGATFTWAPSTGLGATTSGATVHPGISALSSTTTYTVTATVSGCSNTATKTVSVNTTSNASVTGSHVKGACYWFYSTLYSTVPISATGASSYTWAPATNLTATTGSSVTSNLHLLPSFARTYTVTGTDANGCKSKDTVKVEVVNVDAYPQQGNTSFNYFPGNIDTVQMVAMNGLNTFLSGYGYDSMAYTWTPTTNILYHSSTGNPNPLFGGVTNQWDTILIQPVADPIKGYVTYTYTGTYKGCPVDTTYVPNSDTVQFFPLTLSHDTTIASGTHATLTVGGGAPGSIGTYAWIPSTGLSCTTCASVLASPTVTTTYTVIVTDNYGGYASAAGHVTVTVSSLSVGVTGGTSPICSGGSGTSLTGTGATTYTWSPGTGLSATTGATVTANPTVTTTYTVTGTTGGSSASATVQVTVNTSPTVGISGGSSPICTGTGSSLTGTGATTYTWAPNTNLTATSGATVTASPTVTTTYTVTGTSSGCSATATKQLTVNALPTVSFTAQPGASGCESTNLTYTTQSGMTSYVWGFTGTSGVDYTLVSGGTSISNTATLLYYTSGSKVVSINYTDANGCTAASAVSSTSTSIQMKPVVSSVSPSVGYPASSVTITGTGFNTTAANNIVYFGATKASVSTASGTSLSVSVPTGATFANVTVDNTTCNLIGYASMPFLQDYDNSAYVSGTVNTDAAVNFTAGSSPYGAAIGDIDGDGKADLVVSNFGAGSISVFRNTSTSGSITSGSFAAAATFTCSANPEAVAIADLDGDGKLDIAVVNFGGATVSVFQNTSTSGSISLASQLQYATDVQPESIAIGDIDGDGRPEILVGNNSGTHVADLYKNTSSTGSISFAAKVNIAAGAAPGYLALGDVDGDGKLDLVAAIPGPPRVEVYLNQSSTGTINTSSFGSGTTFNMTSGAGINSVALADIDGDGKLDIIMPPGNNNNNYIEVARNTGTGTGTASFGTPTTFATTTSSTSVPFATSIGDIDGDGKPDVVVSNGGANTISVLRNTSTSGTVSFATHVDFLTGSSNTPRYIAVGDLDGDGLADIVTANNATGNISVLRNEPIKPISGATQVCASGGTITLTDATPNGFWTSGNLSTATVGSASGVVTGAAAGTVTITYYGTANGGPATGNYATYSVTVNALPTIGITGGTSALCAGGSGASLTGTGGTTYTWAPNTNLSATTGASVTATPTITITYTVTGTNGACSNTATVQVTVNPVPVMTVTPSSQTVCNNANTSTIVFTSSVTGTTYSWNNSTPSIGLSTSGTGVFIASFTATNTGTAPVSAVLTVTPTANSCVGSVQIFTITVEPTPIMSVTPTTQTVCNSGNTASEVFSSNVAGTTYTWTNNNFNIGISNSGSGGSIGSFTATNTGTAPIAGNFTVTPTANGCPGPAQNFTITVEPTPIMTVTPTTQTVCNNANTSVQVFTSNVTGTTYTWANNNTTTGISASGSGSTIASFTATNTGTAPISSVFTVTPSANSCPGPVKNFTITVEPTPIMSVTPTSQAVCSNSNTTTEVFSSNVSGTTYSWSNSNTSIGIGASGVGSTIASFMATNSGSSQIAGVFTVTPAANGCTGPAQNFTISVNPTPAAITGALAFPVGTTSTLASGTSGGTWTSVTGGVATIAGSTGVATGVNTGTSLISYTIGSCAATATVTVNPASGINWYSNTAGGDASVLTNWWRNNNNTGYQPTTYSHSGDTWIFQSNMTSTAALAFGGNVSIVSGGTFTPLASSNTMVGGDFTQASGGSFVPNTGTVTMNGASGTITAAGMTTPTTNCFYHLAFNAAATTTYTIASDLLLMGDFNNQTANGTIAIGSHTLTIGGNWNNSGPFTTGSNTVIMNGGVTVTMTGKR